MCAKIIKHGRLSPYRNEYIEFTCNNCECVFKVKDNDKNLIIKEELYGFIFKNKRHITYSYVCPECNKITTMDSFPDEYDDI